LALASEALENRPLGLSLLCLMHAILMGSARGSNEMPEEFRREKNWIGAAASPIERASFIPPALLQLRDHLLAWENYLAGKDTDVLLQYPVAHAQFELIHPFKDGNGRIGRLLIPLFLFQKRALSRPMFYLSEYLETHRDDYYARLRAIGQGKDWNAWIAFFLEAFICQARDNTRRARGILRLYEEMKRSIADLTHSQYAIAVLDALFDRPVFQSSDFIQRSGVPGDSARIFLRTPKNQGVLQVLRESSGRQAAVLAFKELLNCAEGRRVLWV
jgi:Fic family protein